MKMQHDKDTLKDDYSNFDDNMDYKEQGVYQFLIAFDNGYGASVVTGPYPYGGEEGLYELAVLKNEKITYDTEITNDVLGHLSHSDVMNLLADIEAL